MTRTRRRTFLASLGALGGLSGCLTSTGTDDQSSPDSTGTTATASSASTATTTATAASIRLSPVAELPTDATATVYPATLRSWLRRAAGRTEPVHGHDEAFRYAPEPFLEGVEAVDLVGSRAGDAAEVSGTYDVALDGGPRYRLHVGATPVEEPPADASVTPLSTLSDGRRELVRRAIDTGRRAEVFPETALGSWVRTAFLGGYVADDEQVYRGHEIEQTDAAFFSTEVWYVLSLSPTETAATLTLRLSTPPTGVERRLDPLLEESKGSGGALRTDAEPLPRAVERFATETTYLLTHTTPFAVELVP